MSAATAPRKDWDINLIQVRRGRFVHLDDIATATEGQAILDELDASILSVENQLANPGTTEHGWRRKAEFALRTKRLQRPRLQQRIAALRMRDAGPGHAKRDAKRKAFINAAEELLTHDVFTEIWARATELDPPAFAAEREVAA